MIRTLGIVLAGGLGRRLGQPTPKALVRLAGTTLLERAIATLAEESDQVVVVAPRELELPIAAPARAVHDRGEGPLVALVEGLAVAFDRALVLGVDFPLARAKLLAALARHLETGAVAVVPRPGALLQPLVAAYAPQAREALAAAVAGGERSLVRAVTALEPRVIDGADLERLAGGSESFLNVNTPLDLAEAQARLGSRVGRA